jgi:hypothetical protein
VQERSGIPTPECRLRVPCLLPRRLAAYAVIGGLFGAAAPAAGQFSTQAIGPGVAVSPDAKTEPTRAPNTGNFTTPFTVFNSGTTALNLDISCVGRINVTCVSQSASFLSLASGATSTVNVTYKVGSAGTGRLVVLAVQDGGPGDSGWVKVPVVSPDRASVASLSPYNGEYRGVAQCQEQRGQQQHLRLRMFCDLITGISTSASPRSIWGAASSRRGQAMGISCNTEETTPGKSPPTFSVILLRIEGWTKVAYIRWCQRVLVSRGTNTTDTGRRCKQMSRNPPSERKQLPGLLKARLFCLLFLGLACARTPTDSAAVPPQNRYGYIVVDSSATKQYGFGRGDTLIEIPSADAPAPIIEAAQSQASSEGFDTRCTRYFERDQVFLVLFVATCDQQSTVEDGTAIAVMKRTGEPVGATAWWLSGFYTAIWPSVRPHL